MNSSQKLLKILLTTNRNVKKIKLEQIKLFTNSVRSSKMVTVDSHFTSSCLWPNCTKWYLNIEAIAVSISPKAEFSHSEKIEEKTEKTGLPHQELCLSNTLNLPSNMTITGLNTHKNCGHCKIHLCTQKTTIQTRYWK